VIRLFVHTAAPQEAPWQAGALLELPSEAARHAQVRRVQPGDALHIFNGQGVEFVATVTAMGRRDVQVQLIERVAVECELPWSVTLAVGMPANERMDTLVEKATELGVAAIQPLQCERSVLKLDADRAQKKVQHWQAVAVAASEQCGRAVVPQVRPVCSIKDWWTLLPSEPANEATRWVLSLDARAPAPNRPVLQQRARPAVWTLSGPEGGLTPDEEQMAVQAGFSRVHLGPRVLRADTAPLAVLAWLGMGH